MMIEQFNKGDAIMNRQTYIEMAQELAAWANRDWNAFHTVSPFIAFQQMGYSLADARMWMRANSEEEW